jgi:hypothetical protein
MAQVIAAFAAAVCQKTKSVASFANNARHAGQACYAASTDHSLNARKQGGNRYIGTLESAANDLPWLRAALALGGERARRQQGAAAVVMLSAALQADAAMASVYRCIVDTEGMDETPALVNWAAFVFDSWLSMLSQCRDAFTKGFNHAHETDMRVAVAAAPPRARAVPETAAAVQVRAAAVGPPATHETEVPAAARASIVRPAKPTVASPPAAATSVADTAVSAVQRGRAGRQPSTIGGMAAGGTVAGATAAMRADATATPPAGTLSGTKRKRGGSALLHGLARAPTITTSGTAPAISHGPHTGYVTRAGDFLDDERYTIVLLDKRYPDGKFSSWDSGQPEPTGFRVLKPMSKPTVGVDASTGQVVFLIREVDESQFDALGGSAVAGTVLEELVCGSVNLNREGVKPTSAAGRVQVAALKSRTALLGATANPGPAGRAGEEYVSCAANATAISTGAMSTVQGLARLSDDEFKRALPRQHAAQVAMLRVYSDSVRSFVHDHDGGMGLASTTFEAASCWPVAAHHDRADVPGTMDSVLRLGVGGGYKEGDVLLFNWRLKLLAPHRSYMLGNFFNELHAVTRMTCQPGAPLGAGAGSSSQRVGEGAMHKGATVKRATGKGAAGKRSPSALGRRVAFISFNNERLRQACIRERARKAAASPSDRMARR